MRNDAVAAFACRCGARDEQPEPAPATLPCWSCKADRMARWIPLCPPPADAGQRR